FPSPVGGTPYSNDFAPSTVFAVLYALLLPIHIYHMSSKRASSGTCKTHLKIQNIVS
ncbi:hypothetical protein BKA93DRAFT_735285, partial [Sparassis latifolia]